MRKLFVSAAAITASLAVAGGAIAQVQNAAGDATFDATLLQQKAGTKSNPRGHTLRTVLKVARPGSTVEVIELTVSKNLKINAEGLKKCSKSALTEGGPTACPAGSAAGPKGTATALIEPGNSPLNFDVFPFVKNERTLMFYLDQTPAGVQATLEGKILNKGRKIRITIPHELRQPAPGLNATLTGIDQSFKAKRGSRHLISSRGCTAGTHQIGGRLIFAVRSDGNPVPPPESLIENVPCTK